MSYRARPLRLLTRRFRSGPKRKRRYGPAAPRPTATSASPRSSTSSSPGTPARPPARARAHAHIPAAAPGRFANAICMDEQSHALHRSLPHGPSRASLVVETVAAVGVFGLVVVAPINWWGGGGEHGLDRLSASNVLYGSERQMIHFMYAHSESDSRIMGIAIMTVCVGMRWAQPACSSSRCSGTADSSSSACSTIASWTGSKTRPLAARPSSTTSPARCPQTCRRTVIRHAPHRHRPETSAARKAAEAPWQRPRGRALTAAQRSLLNVSTANGGPLDCTGDGH